MRAIFDTGSANPWILAKQGTLDMDPGLEVYYFDPELSDTFFEPPDSEK